MLRREINIGSEYNESSVKEVQLQRLLDDPSDHNSVADSIFFSEKIRLLEEEIVSHWTLEEE